jgi:hypothetical protein
MNADHAPLCRTDFSRADKTDVGYRRIFCSVFLSREIVMTLSCMRTSISRAVQVAISIATAVTAVSWTGAALASQGPGGGMGTASHVIQLAMAILVYGTSAIIVGAGLIGAVRGRSGIDGRG